LIIGKSSSIRQSFPDRASQKACYRFLNNEKVNESALIEELTNRSGSLTSGRHLLVIQDTTSFNLNNHYHRIKKDNGIGTIEDNFSLGFFLHASMIIDAFSGSMLGFSDVQLWNRVYNNPRRKYLLANLPIEKKESYKWIRACEQTKITCPEAAAFTFIEDRDGDIYEQFARITDKRTNFIIRICKNRLLSNGFKLYETLEKQSCAGRYEIELTGDKRKKRFDRKACIDVSFCKVCIKRSERNVHSEIAETIEAYAVQAIENDYNGKDKICWRLLTTHCVETFEQAIDVVELYRQRWHIEQLFRLLKKQGFEMEESELETGWALRKLSILTLNASLRIMQLMHATQDENAQPLSEVFTKTEQQCLEQANRQLNGSSAKQMNPYKPSSLIWARWIIARLGGWKGYSSQRNAGPITIKRGLDNFNQMYYGWCLALKYFEDVGTQ
jgi:Transposase DDE domain